MLPENKAVTAVPVTSVFKSPDNLSENVDELLFGDEIEIIGEENGFFAVVTDYGYKGYAEMSAFSHKTDNPTHIVISSFCDVLPEPKNFYKPILTLPRGAKLKIFGEATERYVYTELNGKKCFIHKKHLSPYPVFPPKDEIKLREELVNVAESYLGVQYRWGGRSHFGIDCSGLCFNAYRFCGINIWRDADIEKSDNLFPLDISDSSVGDLVFFKGHVAMHLGNGDIIHSNASNGKVNHDNFYKNKDLQKIYLTCGTLFK